MPVHHLGRRCAAPPKEPKERRTTRLIADTTSESTQEIRMAQVYPEDRGTNYAIRDGRKVARTVDEWLRSGHSAGSL